MIIQNIQDVDGDAQPISLASAVVVLERGNLAPRIILLSQ